MTSQVLAVFYLNDMDHFIKNELHIKGVIRYQDDFLLFHESKEYLKYCLEQLTKFLEKEDLKLNKKTRIYKSTDNFIFIGRNKYGNYACNIDNNTINTTIGALANTGILKVSADDSGSLIVKDPRDTTKNLNSCGIQIIKSVDNKFKVTYQIKGSTQDGCPTTEDLQ